MAKPKMVKSALDQQIADLVAKTDKKILVTWACECAERVLPYFEKKRPDDQRPRRANETARTWVRDGVFKMAAIRGASLAAHGAAREVRGDDAPRPAGRGGCAGQVVARTHVPTHAVAAAIYSATAIRDSVAASEGDAAVAKERQWQYQRLVALRERAG